MSKRVRGPSRATHRPGTRPPSERSTTQRRSSATQTESQLEIAEIAAEDIVEHRPAAASNELERAAVSAGQRTHHKVKAGSLLATRAATEYVYVAQDIRRIVVVAGALIGFLFLLWLLVVYLKVIALPFY